MSLLGRQVAEAAAAQKGARPDDVPPVLPRQLSDAEFQLLASAGERREIEAGETIIRKGEFGHSMFLIESGRVLLEFGGDLPDKLIGAREFFGELALFIGEHSRVANAVASETALLYCIEHAAFEKLLDREPKLLAQFMRRSFAYLVASEQQLIAYLTRRNEDLVLTLDSLRETQSQLSVAQRLVQTDELTGLWNRRGLYRFLNDIAAAPDNNRPMGLLLIDLDRFKSINDRDGHLMGDEVLRATANEVRSVAGPCDLPCRLGGDEFALLAEVADPRELKARAAQLVAAIRAMRFPAPHKALAISVSIGGGLCRQPGSWSVWYSDADTALYRVKGSGGDGWHVRGD